MWYRTLCVVAFSICSVPAHSGEDVGLVFKSSFETGENCWTLSAFSDPINIKAISIEGDFSLNGQPFPQSEYDDAEFFLRDLVTGDELLLGNSHFNSYSERIAPGFYDVIYKAQTLGPVSPHNVDAVVMEQVPLFADQTLDINVIAHEISGVFRLNGGLFPHSGYDHGDLVLVGDKGGRLKLGNSYDNDFHNLMVIQGDYQVRFESTQATLVPHNKNGFVRNLSVGNGSIGPYFINVASVELSGTFRHNGALWPVSEYADGLFYLETAEGDRVFLENSHYNQFTKQVMPGVYDVYWELQTPANTVPVNTRAKVASNVDVSGGTININVISYLTSGDFIHNGEAFPGSVTQTGKVILRDKIDGQESTLGKTNEGSYQHRIIKGAYETVYQHQLGVLVPQNRNAVLNNNFLVNNAATRHVYALSSLLYSTPFNNGQLFPASVLESANIWLRNLQTGDEVLLGKTSQQNFNTQIINGTYDAYYNHLTGDLLPQNHMGLVQKNVIIAPPPAPKLTDAETHGGGSTGYPINVYSTVINGAFKLNGNETPNSEYDDGFVSLKNLEDYVQLGNSHDHEYSRRVLFSDYFAHFGVQTPGPIAPHNKDARLYCVRMDAPIH